MGLCEDNFAWLEEIYTGEIFDWFRALGIQNLEGDKGKHISCSASTVKYWKLIHPNVNWLGRTDGAST